MPETIAQHAERAHPHEGACELCRATLHCNYCGKNLNTPAERAARCTNGRCGDCHGSVCTPGGSTSPGHGFGKVGPHAATA